MCVRRTGIAWVEIYIVYLFRQFYVSPSTDRMAFAHVFHRGTPGVRSLQAVKSPHEIKTVGSDSGLKKEINLTS